MRLSQKDRGENKNGEGLIEQNLTNESTKEVVKTVKKGLSVVSVGQAATNTKNTAESPYKVVSLWNDDYSGL